MKRELTALGATLVLLLSMEPTLPAIAKTQSEDSVESSANPVVAQRLVNKRQFTHPDGKTIFTVFPDTRSELVGDTREITYRMESEPKDVTAPSAMTGVEQINCRTRKRRTIALEFSDPAPALKDVSNLVRADEPWIDLSEGPEDRLLFESACDEHSDQMPISNPIPNYPALALREGRSGRATYRITVSLSGDVTECTITVTSGHADLDAATCDFARKLKKTGGIYQGALSWQLPD
ncbi:MAG TPA: energy transducer TonB [Sphingopyxis sp.]|uniref:energy transducer TonB n=1 Tax=Sphingopyxis sp. TaxID=1908224 RepID=UPI002B8286E9|nr:energy transducer TonB [Sphingopyxis sp.]HWW56335.1 energy transducer TonB [Sphingopyxis sp.]